LRSLSTTLQQASNCLVPDGPVRLLSQIGLMCWEDFVASGGKRIGQFVAQGSWDGYWETAICDVYPELRVRGYSVAEIIPKLSYAETAFMVIRGEVPTPQQARVFDAALCAAPDAGLFSVHAPTARFVASAQPRTPVPAIVAGLLCAGDVTISPQASGTLIEQGVAAVEEGIPLTEIAAKVVAEHLENELPVPGIGHPMQKVRDPRAAALRKVAEDEGVWGEGGGFYDALHGALVEQLGMHLPMNVDGVLASVLHDLGFTARQMPGIALLAILPGIIAHVDEEITVGVPSRIIPESTYVGQGPRPLVGGHWGGSSA
jgi:citryl-CoA lyase